MNYVNNIVGSIFGSIKNVFLSESANNILPVSGDHGSLWLGDYTSALDPMFLKDNNISVIINCSPDLPYIYDIIDKKKHGFSKLETFRIPVYDSLLDHDIYIMEEYYHKVIPFLLQKILIEHSNVLIHCYAGKQRSASLIAAILYVLVDTNAITIDEIPIKEKIPKNKLMKKVIQYIQIKRPCVFTYGLRINFKRSLESFFDLKIN